MFSPDGIEPPHRLEHLPHAAVGVSDRVAVPRRAERRMVAAVIGLRKPHDRQRRRPLLDDFAAEPLGHRAVAVQPLVQRGARRVVERLPPGTVAAGRVIDIAVPVRVLEIGRAGRDVGAGDRDLAMPAQPLGEGRDMQGAAGRAAHPVGEIGVPGRAADQSFALVERHRVAEEAMPRRQTAGRDRGGARPRGRGKTLRCAVNQAPRSPSSKRNGVSSGPIRSARRLSQMTMTARFVPFIGDPGHA